MVVMLYPSIIDSLDDLELKINHLQRRVIGNDSFKPENGISIQEMLLQSETTLNDAVSSHSRIKDLLKRREELDKYLDPTFWDSFLDTVTKVQIIFDAEDELRETIGQFKELNQLMECSNTSVFQTLPESEAQLAVMMKEALELQEQSNKLKTAVNSLVTKYINIIKYTDQVVLQLTTKIDQMEESLQRVNKGD